MAVHVLNLVSGATTLQLSAAGVALVRYTPKSAIGSAEITESIEIAIIDVSASAARAKLRAIQAMLDAARKRRETQTGARVFLSLQPANDTVAWRSEIFSGTVLLDDDAMLTLDQAIIACEIVITRAPFWEGARTQIPLTNPNGENNTAGLTINNGSTNFADISAPSVVGDLPAPLEIRLRNTSGASRGYSGFHMANNIFTPSTAIHIEAETNTSNAPVSALTGASGGQIATVTGANPAAIAFNLPAATVNAHAGRWVRVLARCPSLGAGGSGALYIWAQLYDYYGLVPLYATPPTPARDSTLMQDFGALPLPPGGANGTNWSQLVLRLWFRGASTALGAAIDYVALAPGEPQRYRYLVQRGMLVQNNDWMVDDGIENAQYLIEAGANHPIYASATPALYVWPTVAQRLYAWQDGTGVRADWTMQIQAFYRPRIATL